MSRSTTTAGRALAQPARTPHNTVRSSLTIAGERDGWLDFFASAKVMMLSVVANAETQAGQYRELAEAMRSLVPTWKDPETRAELAWMADCYERLADFADEASKRRLLEDS